MSYGFKENQDSQSRPAETKKTAITLGTKKGAEKHAVAAPDELRAVMEAGKAAGFIPRQPTSYRRKPGPKRTEPQGKLTLTGPKRVLDRLQAYCDAMGGAPYWRAIEAMLDKENTEA